jgi:phosphoribosylaminoimidazole (AIR) synthetase
MLLVLALLWVVRKKTGRISEAEMVRTFNCGIGMVLIVKKSAADDILKTIQKEDPVASVIGTIKQRKDQAVIINNASSKFFSQIECFMI